LFSYHSSEIDGEQADEFEHDQDRVVLGHHLGCYDHRRHEAARSGRDSIVTYLAGAAADQHVFFGDVNKRR